MVDAPEKIWIEQDDCPYFYEESELTEVGSPVTEYVRADLCSALEAQLAEAKIPTHRHKKRGSEYVLIGIGKMQALEWGDLKGQNSPTDGRYIGTVDMREVAIYRSATDPAQIWVRPREEFEDGRFEEIARAFAEKAGA